MSLKNQVEAVLYSTGRKTTTEEISNIVKAKPSDVVRILKQLQDEYNKRDSALMITGVEGVWKIDVKEKYIELCRNIISEMDLEKSTMETLAMIAYSQPAIQSQIIRKRTNKAYDHIKDIEKLGFISREKYGRTKKINLTQKFFDYFDINRKEIEAIFEEFRKLEKKGDEKEKEMSQLEEQRKQVEEQMKKKEKEKKENAVNFEQELNSIDESPDYKEPKPDELDWVAEEKRIAEERAKLKAEKEARKQERELMKAQEQPEKK
jgi:segregation and condensation protein B